jgi:hypothetical protein
VRNGKHLKERTEALGFTERDWDERMHDVLDFVEEVASTWVGKKVLEAFFKAKKR